MKKIKIKYGGLVFFVFISLAAVILLFFQNCGDVNIQRTNFRSSPVPDPEPLKLMLKLLAGSAGGAGNVDGQGTAARFDSPEGIVVDPNGNIYVADTSNDTIRKITSTGMVTTVAGIAKSYGSNDGQGTAARFFLPTGVALDANGNFYFADRYNYTIRKIDSAGMVTTIAGFAGSYGSTDGQGTAARFYNPTGVAVDSSGNIYVADSYNHTIRKITSTGMVTTIAGQVNSKGSNDGQGTAARFYTPQGVAVDTNGDIFVADTNNHTIRKITSTGMVTTIIGQVGKTKNVIQEELPATLVYPRSVAVSDKYIYISSGDAIMFAPKP